LQNNITVMISRSQEIGNARDRLYHFTTVYVT
jgi:hypothetical protein